MDLFFNEEIHITMEDNGVCSEQDEDLVEQLSTLYNGVSRLLHRDRVELASKVLFLSFGVMKDFFTFVGIELPADVADLGGSDQINLSSEVSHHG